MKVKDDLVVNYRLVLFWRVLYEKENRGGKIGIYLGSIALLAIFFMKKKVAGVKMVFHFNSS